MKDTVSLNRIKRRITLILILTILIQIFLPILTKSDKANAVTTTCSNATSFGELMRNANDGDIIKIANNMTLGQESKFRIKNNCFVTLDLNYHTHK